MGENIPALSGKLDYRVHFCVHSANSSSLCSVPAAVQMRVYRNDVRGIVDTVLQLVTAGVGVVLLSV